MHEKRMQLGLNMNEYAFLDLVYRLSTNPKAPITGWCNMKKQMIADFLGLDKRTVMRISSRLFEAGFIEKSQGGTLLKTTEVWFDDVDNVNVTRGGKVSPLGGQSVTLGGAKCHPSIYKDESNIKNNRESESALDFLKIYCPSKLEAFEMQYKSEIKSYEKFKDDFNSTVEIEQLPYVQKVILNRLLKYARNWTQNQSRFQLKQDQTIRSHELQTNPNYGKAI